MKRFIIKKIVTSKSKFDKSNLVKRENNQSLEKDTIMDNKQIEKIQSILNTSEIEKPIKKIKKDKSIIERSESSKIIINEDNKQLLND